MNVTQTFDTAWSYRTTLINLLGDTGGNAARVVDCAILVLCTAMVAFALFRSATSIARITRHALDAIIYGIVGLVLILWLLHVAERSTIVPNSWITTQEL